MTVIHGCANEDEEEKERIRNKKRLHTAIVQDHIQNTPPNPILDAQPPEIHSSEQQLCREARRTLAQLRAGKCPLLQGYLHAIGAADHPSCPLCGHGEHNTVHIFACPSIPTDLTPVDLWRRPTQAADLVGEWRAALAAAEEA